MFGKKKSYEERLFRVCPVPPPDAKDDNVLVLIDRKVCEEKGIALDKVGFPVPVGLVGWLRKNNPGVKIDVEE